MSAPAWIDREEDQPFEEPVRLPIEEVFDLHPFAPKEIPSVVEEYLGSVGRRAYPRSG